MILHKGSVVGRRGSYDIIECETCGFKHVDPLPSELDLKNIYQNEYYTDTIPDYIQRHQRDQTWWLQTYKNRLQQMRAAGLSNGNRFLDVGSGPGLMLQAAYDDGWDSLGIEPNTVAASYARSNGCQVIEDFLSPDIASSLGTFDAIHNSEVLEHIRQPAEFISLMGSVLNPGGTICIVVPNDFNPLQMALVASGQQTDWWLAPPYHLNYFTHESLKKLVESCGLEIVLLTSTFPIELFLAMGENYIGNDQLGSLCHEKRKIMETTLAQAGHQLLIDQLYQKFSEMGIGREIVLIARKPLS